MTYFSSSVDGYLSCFHILLFWIMSYCILGEGLSGLSREIEPVHSNADRHTRRDWLQLEVYKPHCWQSAAGNSRAAHLNTVWRPQNLKPDGVTLKLGPMAQEHEWAQEYKGYRPLSWDTGKGQPSFWKERLWAFLAFSFNWSLSRLHGAPTQRPELARSIH